MESLPCPSLLSTTVSIVWKLKTYVYQDKYDMYSSYYTHWVICWYLKHFSHTIYCHGITSTLTVKFFIGLPLIFLCNLRGYHHSLSIFNYSEAKQYFFFTFLHLILLHVKLNSIPTHNLPLHAVALSCINFIIASFSSPSLPSPVDTAALPLYLLQYFWSPSL